MRAGFRCGGAGWGRRARLRIGWRDDAGGGSDGGQAAAGGQAVQGGQAMSRSLGVLLAIALAGLQFLAVLVVVSSSYVTSERALLQHARDLLRDVGINTIEHSKGFLSPAEGAAELAARLAQNRVIVSEDQDQLERLLFQQLQIAPQFAGVYYGSRNGGFVYVMRSADGPAAFRSKIITIRGSTRTTELIWRDKDFSVIARETDPTDRFDPRSRLWYQKARAARETIWTDPYIFFSSHQPGITLAAPVLDTGRRLRGVVGVDIEISAISRFLARLNIGAHGKAMIIHRNGDVIAHPDLELIKITATDGTLRFANIAEFGDPIARMAFGALAGEQKKAEARAASGKAGVRVGVDAPAPAAEVTATVAGAAGPAVADSAPPGSAPAAPRPGVPAIEVNAEFTHDGKRYVASVMPIISEKLPWTIAVYAPEDDFTGVIKRNRTQNIWIAAAVAVVTGLAGLALANYLSRPVRAFAVRSSLIAQGEIAPDAPAPRTYRELERANDTLVQQIVARREAEHEYGQTFDLASRAMAQIAPGTGAFIRVNARFCEIAGRSAEDLSRLSLADLLAPGERVALPGIDEAEAVEAGAGIPAGPAAAGEDEAADQATHLLRGDGSSVWVKVNAILIRDHRGQPLHSVVTVDDVTGAREREAQILRLNRDLSHLARGNTMGQMASGLAHELNQPLTAIAQNADTALLVLDQDNAAVDPELREILQEIERQSLRAGEIIRALRGFIRKDEGSRETFDFGALLGQTLRLVQADAAEAGVRILTQPPPQAAMGPVEVLGNRVQVAQVLVNLIRNAIEAMVEGGCNDRAITLSAVVEGGQLQVTAADTGPGIPPDIQLFTQFETSKAEGMGLGLSICRAIIEANGGRIWQDGLPGQGARFHFTLPLASPLPEMT